MTQCAYVTLLTKAAYLPGCLVLDQCLRSVESKWPLVVMVTPTLAQTARDVLQRRGIRAVDVAALQPEDGVHSLSEHDARFGDTWTKLRAFELVDYERIVLMDSDMIVMRNMDELFDLGLASDQIAAAHVCACNPRKLAHYPADWIPENCAHSSVGYPTAPAPTISPSSPRPYNQLNSGLIVLNPSTQLMHNIAHYLSTSPLVPKFSFPDQDLLAAFFAGKWVPLLWYYNALKTLRIVHKPLWKDNEVRCLHYILADKPWQARIGAQGADENFEEVHGWWWDRFGLVEKELEDDAEALELIRANVAKPL